MDKLEFMEQFKAHFPMFDLKSDNDNIHGRMRGEHQTFRDKNKDLITTFGYRTIFVSGIMGTAEKPFHYCTIYTASQKRNYRCKNWYTHEYNKMFVSAMNYELLLEKLKEQTTEVIKL